MRYVCKFFDLFFIFPVVICIGLSTSQYLAIECNTIRVDNFQCDKSITVIDYLNTCVCKQITMEMLKPVYLKNSELPHSNDNRITDYELSVAASLCASDLKCVQKDRELWRLYVNSQESRTKLLCEGFEIRNTNVRIYDTNPFSAGLSNPDEKVLKITVKGVPLSVDDGEVMKMLNKFNLSFTSDLKYEKIRHPETHKMIGILNGNRFIYAKALPQGTFLPRSSNCAGLKCFIYHYGQPSNKRTPYCTQCWEDSHIKRDCPNNPRCKVCKAEGHKPGDPECKHFTEPLANVIPFAGESLTVYQISTTVK